MSMPSFSGSCDYLIIHIITFFTCISRGGLVEKSQRKIKWSLKSIKLWKWYTQFFRNTDFPLSSRKKKLINDCSLLLGKSPQNKDSCVCLPDKEIRHFQSLRMVSCWSQPCNKEKQGNKSGTYVKRKK